jgi:adenine phosphoribosyltransferase
MRLGAGFVMARKPGKLPAETWSESYTKEYGEDRLEIHCDAISSDDVVLIHDDLLATGGTVAAVSRLVGRFNPQKQYMGFIISLKDVPRVEAFPEDVETFSLLNL